MGVCGSSSYVCSSSSYLCSSSYICGAVLCGAVLLGAILSCADLPGPLLRSAPADAGANVPAILRSASARAVRAIHGCCSPAASDAGGHDYDRAPPVLEHEKDQQEDNQEEEKGNLSLKDRSSPDQVQTFLVGSRTV